MDHPSKTKFCFTILFLSCSALAIDDDFFSNPILGQYLPRESQPTPLPQSKGVSDTWIADQVEAIWSQNKNRVEQNGNAAWETDFVTEAKDQNLNRLIYENGIDPAKYKSSIEIWAQKYKRGVIKGPQTLESAGEKIFRAGEGK